MKLKPKVAVVAGIMFAVELLPLMIQRWSISLCVLMAIFPVDLGYLIPECLRSGFYWNCG